MQIADERDLGRAKNAILELFNDKLYIPKIYLDAVWEGGKVDVLAIDRDGIGDVHLVLLVAISQFENPTQLANLLQPTLSRIANLSAQYKYLALVEKQGSSAVAVPGLPVEILDQALAEDGLGRIGFLSVTLPYGAEPNAKYLLKPERFRARVTDMADDYVRHHNADWELRDSPAA